MSDLEYDSNQLFVERIEALEDAVMELQKIRKEPNHVWWFEQDLFGGCFRCRRCGSDNIDRDFGRSCGHSALSAKS